MHDREPHISAKTEHHTGGLDIGVGQRSVEILNVKDGLGVLADRRKLNAKKLKPLKIIIDHIHNEGSEVYGYWAGHKGFVLSVVSAAAFTAGIVGIGIRVRRRGERKK